MTRRALLGVAALGVTGFVMACTSPAKTSAGPNRVDQPAPPSNTAEVVMGTLTAPPTKAFISRIHRGLMGGVILLGNDWLSKSTAASVTAELQQAACKRGEPLLIGVDQEGGIVRRLYWAPPTEAPADMTSPSVAHSQAAGAAAALRSVGVDVDFAPVVDTPSSPSNFLGTRAFSRSRTWNAQMAKAFVDGLQQHGIAATAKHFPGLGLASGNTDNGVIEIDAAKWKIEQDLLPFESAIKAGVKLVMVSTGIYPKLDASRKPAAFSDKIIVGILRKQLGFKGVTVTDSLTAPAAEAIPNAAPKAMEAGSDLLLYGSEAASEQAYSQLLAGGGSAKLQARLAEAAGRIRALKTWLSAHGGPRCSG